MPSGKNVKKIEAIIELALPNATFKARADGGQEILAHLSGKMRLHYIKVVPGDRVVVELSPYDETRGRITKRL